MDALDVAIKTSGADAFVVYASSDDADIRYLTRFVVHDPFVFFKRRRQPGTIIVSQMEAERASRESTTAVMTRTQAGLIEILKTEKNPWKAQAAMITGQAGENLLVSPNLPAALVRALEEHARVIVDESTVEQMRAKKSIAEIAWMKSVQKNTDVAMTLAVSLIARSTVKKGLLYLKGAPLTSDTCGLRCTNNSWMAGAVRSKRSSPVGKILRSRTRSVPGSLRRTAHRDRYVPQK